MGSSSKPPQSSVSPFLVALAGWFIPGAGYWILGHRARGLISGITIVVLFLLGILLAGIRVIDVPGYDRLGGQVRIDPTGRRVDSLTPGDYYFSADWALLGRGFFGEIANKPWYVAQVLAGPLTLISSGVSISAARASIPPSHGRIFEIGTLYTAIAGMLNLLVIIDSAARAAAASAPQRAVESAADGARIVRHRPNAGGGGLA